MIKLLVVDDDESIINLLRMLLERNQYIVFEATDYNSAMAVMEKVDIDGALLDVVLPDKNGLMLLQRIREHPVHRTIPVMMLTAKTDEIDTVLGLEMGADDYIHKPFRKRELVARLNVLFRRIEMEKQRGGRKIAVGDLVLDLASKSAYAMEKPIHMSPREFDLLALLIKNMGRILSRDEIMNQLWDEEIAYESRTVDVHIRKIRAKLKDALPEEAFIETVRGYGYRFRG